MKVKGLERVAALSMPDGVRLGTWSRRVLPSCLKRIMGNRAGSGLGAVLACAALMVVVFLVFITAVDYGLYSMKYKILGRGIDYAACSAVMEIDIARSREGLSDGYYEQSGAIAVDGIYIDGEKANNIFFATLSANTGIKESELRKHILTVVVSPLNDALECTFYKEEYSEKVTVDRPEMIEQAVNSMLCRLYPDEGPGADRKIIFVNGNVKTNEFKKRPYFIAFTRGYDINGLFRNRKADFACFADARVERVTRGNQP